MIIPKIMKIFPCVGPFKMAFSSLQHLFMARMMVETLMTMTTADSAVQKQPDLQLQLQVLASTIPVG